MQHSHITLKASIEGAHLFAAKIGFRIRHNFLGILLGSKSNSLVHKLLVFVKYREFSDKSRGYQHFFI